MEKRLKKLEMGRARCFPLNVKTCAHQQLPVFEFQKPLLQKLKHGWIEWTEKV